MKRSIGTFKKIMSFISATLFPFVLVSAVKNENNPLVLRESRSETPGFDTASAAKAPDLETYIKSLEQMVAFYAKFSNDIDVNTVFGFHLLKLNLDSAILNKRKGVPNSLIVRLKVIAAKSKKIVDYFHMMASQPKFQTPTFKQMRKKSFLYKDESVWLPQMKKPEKKLKDPPKVTPDGLLKRFSSFSEYITKISKVKRMVPSYILTDRCLTRLSDNPVFFGLSALPKCKLYPECVHGVTKGNNTGYGVINRLMILLLAQFGRRCSVVNQKEDKKIADTLCSNSYHEAWFITLYEFTPIMLLLDQMTYCSLNGNVEFLRKEWLSYVLALQTPYGCFSDLLIVDRPPIAPDFSPTSQWTMDKGNLQRDPETQCYEPASSAAAAILSAAVKYILEYTYVPPK